MYEFLDKRYALALYKIAEEKNKVEEYLQVLREICGIIDNNKELHEIVEHPQISTNEKKAIFDRIFRGKIDDEILAFLKLLIDKGRILYLREKLNQMEKIHLNELNTIEGVVKSVIPLTDEEYKRLLDKLEKKYNKHIILERQIDKSLIGGLYVRVENEVIDGSIKSKYEDMRLLMLNKK